MKSVAQFAQSLGLCAQCLGVVSLDQGLSAWTRGSHWDWFHLPPLGTLSSAWGQWGCQNETLLLEFSEYSCDPCSAQDSHTTSKYPAPRPTLQRLFTEAKELRAWLKHWSRYPALTRPRV
jgi:hypothetical protein